jgi:hypothetical protein
MHGLITVLAFKTLQAAMPLELFAACLVWTKVALLMLATETLLAKELELTLRYLDLELVLCPNSLSLICLLLFRILCQFGVPCTVPRVDVRLDKVPLSESSVARDACAATAALLAKKGPSWHRRRHQSLRGPSA